MLLFCEDVQQPSDQASDTRVSMSNHHAQRPARGACHPIRLKLLECSLDRFGHLSRQHLPSRIRVFIDHMTSAIRALDLHCVNDLLLTAK